MKNKTNKQFSWDDMMKWPNIPIDLTFPTYVMPTQSQQKSNKKHDKKPVQVQQKTVRYYPAFNWDRDVLGAVYAGSENAVRYGKKEMQPVRKKLRSISVVVPIDYPMSLREVMEAVHNQDTSTFMSPIEPAPKHIRENGLPLVAGAFYNEPKKKIFTPYEDMMNLESTLNNTFTDVAKTVKSVHNSYIGMRNLATRSKKNPTALGNAREDQYHPDNLPTFKVGYEDYVMNPITGQKQRLEDYIKYHNKFVLAGKTPSGQHGIRKDIGGGIKKMISDYKRKQQVTKIVQGLQEVGRMRREQGSDVIPDMPMDVESEVTSGLPNPESEISNDLPDYPSAPAPVTTDGSFLYPKKPAPQPFPDDAVQQSDYAGKGKEPNAWCFWVTQTSTDRIRGEGVSAPTGKICRYSYGEAKQLHDSYQSRGATVSPLFQD